MYKPMNHDCGTGVIDDQLRWRVEPEYTWKQAAAMANALNANPDIDPDELTRLAEAA